MEKPIFEVQGEYDENASYSGFFDTLKEAEEFAEANLDQFVIHMRMRIAEKKNGKI